MQPFVMEEEFVKIQILAFVMLDTLEMIAKHHFVLVLKILWLVLETMEFVWISILVVVMQDMEEPNVSFQSVLEFSPMKQMFAIQTELVLPQILVIVPAYGLETNVNFLIAMDTLPIKRILFVVEMELAFLQILVFVTMDTLEASAMFIFAVGNYPMIQQFVTHTEIVSEKINALVAMDTQEITVNSVFAI
jgi:hypothetical protein